MKKILAISFFCLGNFLCQAQNLVSNASFELNPITDTVKLADSSDAYQTYYDTSSVPLNSWTVVDDNVVDLHNKYHWTMGCPPSPGGGDYHIDLNQFGKIRQTGIVLQSAKVYTLSFWTSVHSNLVYDSSEAKVEVRNSSTSALIFTQSVSEFPSSRRRWIERKYLFTAPGTSGSTVTVNLTFSGIGSGYDVGGVLIDSVVLEEDIASNSTCSDTCYWKVTGNNILRENRNIFGTLSNHDVQLYTNNTQRGILTKSGDFGWNTSSPTAKMHIDVTGLSATNGVRFQGLTTGTDSIALTVDALGNVHTRTFPVNGTKNTCLTANKVPKVTNSAGDLGCSQIFDDGVNIGINTLIPTVQLHQASAASTASFHKFSNATIGNLISDGFDMGIGATGIAEIRQRENLGINFFTNNTQRATIEANGNIGINISTPTTQLHQASAASTASVHKFSNATIGNLVSDGFDVGIGTTGIAEIRQKENLGINFFTNNAQRATIDANGYIGFNHLTPAANLDIMNSLCDNKPGIKITNDYNNIVCNVGTGHGNYIECMSTSSALPQFVVAEVGAVGIRCTPSSYTSGSGVWTAGAPGSQQVRLDVNGLTRSTSFAATSDAKYKTNVNTLNNSLSSIMKLHGVEYNWKSSQYPEKQFDELKHSGFIAQELMNVLPNSVIKDKDGDFAVDYNSIIPVLTEAIKEQQKQIENQQAQIEELKKILVQNGGKTHQSSESVGESAKPNDAYLAQNIPNPFSNNTEIRYQLPKATSTAVLGIYDLNGKQIRLYPINVEQNSGSVIVQAQELHAGMYIYTLVIDGKAFDSKRMVLTE